MNRIAALVCCIIMSSKILLAQETIILNPLSPGLTVPNNFTGLSYETGLAFHDDYFTPSDTILLNYFKTAGIKVLRIGGNTVENYIYYTGNEKNPNPFDTLLPSEIDSLFAFAKLAGCQIMLGLNFGGDFNPSRYAKEASYVMQHYAAQLLAFEIGNEPNLYNKNGLRSGSYSYDDYRGQFLEYVDSIWHYYPNAPISGPTAALDGWTWASYALPFCHEMKDTITLLTQHYYGAQTFVAPIGQEILNVLSQSIEDSLLSLADTLVHCAALDSLPFRISECNSTSISSKSLYKSGEWGVTNSFTDALWALDYMYALAEAGVVGVNFHTVYGTPACAINDTLGLFSARPLYYGILAFQLGGNGRIIPVNMSGTAQNMTAYSTVDSNGILYLTIINKDTLNAVPVTINAGVNFNYGQKVSLTAPYISATSGFKLAGDTVSLNGKWDMGTWQNVNYIDGNFTDTLPPASAVIMKLSSSTGINSITSGGSLWSVYPNPAQNQVVIKNKELFMHQIQIENIFGQPIINTSVNNDIKEQAIDISNLPEGIYFYRIILNNLQIAAGKFVKE